jgi:hypothetical protein
MKRATCRLLFLLGVAALVPTPAAAGNVGASAFAGNWCAWGNPAKPESIIVTGPLAVEFHNWNDVPATGVLVAPNSHEVVVARWKGIHGTLSADGQTINWSNQTYWKRCSSTVRS